MMSLEVLGRVDQYAMPRSLPLAAGYVRAGFPSPANDYLETELDLVSHLIQHPSATFYVRAKGDSMEDEGIYDGDLLVVDRSLEPKVGNILIITLDNEMTCKRLGKIGNHHYLIAGNPNFKPIPLEGHECHVWGVVTHNIHAHVAGVGK